MPREAKMSVRILRVGSSGRDVGRWQTFLVGRGHLRGVVDEKFGPQTEAATRAFQGVVRLNARSL
jgi:peptidoglycan hydrolase-like protein with peptidoglycan-binding domain